MLRKGMNARALDGGDLAKVLAASDLLFDLALLARRDLDAIDNLIQLGVSQANVRQIVAHPDTQLRYAFADTNPQDDVRRPISVAGLSRVLSLPLETVRRRAIRLCESGLLAATADGLVVPAAAFDTPQHIAVLEAIDRATTRAFERLQRDGFFIGVALPTPDRPPRAPPLRAIGRLAGEFYLRMLAPLHAWAGDPMDAVIVLCLLRRGGEDSDAAAAGGVRLAGPAQIARELGFSSETVRRRLQRMVDKDLCRRDPDGFLVPLPVIRGDMLRRLAEPSELNLRRLFRRLAEVGAVGLEPRFARGDAPAEHPPPG